MLVIGRKKGESILIGDDIEVTILKVDDGNVKVAISAPKNVVILRKELYKAVEEENQQAVVKDISLIKNLKNK
ncbi:carbon storage regulator CsrA [Clostridium sp. JN-9]|uniref:carbon storage regulator CsrA n=1 Tax=Clostridium sp. JN-9 TaxID=2507159 RepID=UPI000FFE22CA|nr:carbon storage regulator CsrA [Clostridium sp. JN-9]QAT40548.1 carbon storage regulator [Clostridium sp. JN-9]